MALDQDALRQEDVRCQSIGENYQGLQRWYHGNDRRSPVGFRVLEVGGDMEKLGHVSNVQNGTLGIRQSTKDFLAKICLVVNFEGKR